MKLWPVLFLFLIQSFTASAQEKNVVCIHGFATNARSMLPIEDSLKCVGFRVWNWDYPSRQRTIEQHACRLVDYLQNIAECYPGEPINFVTHSIGAWILRAALNIPSCPEEAKMGRAVLLAPPNQGSRLAYRFRNFGPIQFVMGTKSGWQLMNYNAADIQTCFGYFPCSMQVLVIAGTRGIKPFFNEPNDGFLALDETALDTPYYWTSFPVKHGTLISYPDVLCCLRTFLYWGYPACAATEIYECGRTPFNYTYYCPN